jgi:hypothetical protein
LFHDCKFIFVKKDQPEKIDRKFMENKKKGNKKTSGSY